MPSSNSELIEAALSLPSGLSEFLNTEIPAIENISVPSTSEEATIAMGVLSANINTILQAFVGLKPVQLQLRISQHHPSIIGMLCASLEQIGTTGLVVIAPINGETYYGYFDSWVVEDDGYDTVTCNLEGVTKESFDLEFDEDSEQWISNWPVALGGWVANFEATRASGDPLTGFSTFEVESWSVYPSSGDTVDAGNVPITIEPAAGQSFDSVSASIGGVTITLSEEAGIWTGILLDTVVGSYQTVYSVTVAGQLYEIISNWLAE